MRQGGMAKTHNSQFAELQEEYLKTRDHRYLDKMYRLCVEVATNYIRKYARKRGLQLDIPELSHDSAIYAIEQYLRKPGFRIESISAYMHLGCVKNLFGNKDRDQREASYDDLLLNEEAAYDIKASPDDNVPAPFKGFLINPSGSRHEPVIIKQGLLFEEGKDYEEILV
jgi:hypothetical protein